jgi:DNA-binding beta-propeller fold protein YncE
VVLRDLPDPVTGLASPPGSVTGLILPAAITALLEPEDVLFGPTGLLFVTDRSTDLVTAYDSAGAAILEVGSGSDLDDPTGLAFGPRGELFVSSYGTDSVLVFGAGAVGADGDGGQLEIGNGTSLDGPAGLAIDLNGNLFVASYLSHEILVFDPSGTLLTTISDPSIEGPWGLAIGPNGRLYVASSGTNRIVVLTHRGDFLEEIGNDNLLSSPADLVFGPNGKLFVTSSANDQLVCFDEDGDGLILVGPGGNLIQPRGLAFAPWLLNTSLKGTFGARDEALSKPKSTGVMTVAPGSGVMMLTLDSSVDDPDPVASAFGAETMVFHGYEIFDADTATKRVFHGTMIPDDATAFGTGTLLLDIKGKLEQGEFGELRAKGTLHRAGQPGVLAAKVTAKPIK